MGAKRTADLIPLCHPLPLDKIAVTCKPDPQICGVRVQCEVRTHGKTGVEMEALTGVQIALLTIYDVVKQVDPHLEVTGVHLKRKEGGKTGVWTHAHH